MRNALTRILQAVVLVAVAVSWASADTDFVHFKKKAAACSYVQKDNNVTGASNGAIGTLANTVMAAGDWLPGSSYSLKRISAGLKIVGDPVSMGITELTIYLAPDATGAPGTLTQIATLAVSTLTTSFVTKVFDYPAGVPITSGALHWQVFKVNAIGDGSNYVAYARNGAGTLEHATAEADANPWSISDATSDMVFDAYSCE